MNPQIWHRFSRDDMFAWYNILNHKLIFTKDSNYQPPNDTADIVRFNQMKERMNKRKKINILYLILTEGCNFNCDYCFFEAGFNKRPPLNPMSFQTARKSVDLFVKLAKKYDSHWKSTKMVNFYGGEPLLNTRVFVQTVKYLNYLKEKGKLPYSLRSSVVTNGSTMTPALAEFIAKNNVEVGVSIDGPPRLHNKHRRTIRKRATFTYASRALKLLTEADANVGVSCTVTPDSSDKLPEIQQWLIDNFKIKNIGFNPLLDSKDYSVNDPKYYIKTAKGMIECFKQARNQGVVEDRMLRKVNAFVGRYFYDRDCSACGRQIVVGPNKTVGICHSFYGIGKYFVKLTKDFDPFAYSIWNEWNQRIPANFSKCLKCPALGICGGGCGFNAYIRHGSIWEVDDTFCEHSLRTLKWLIWETYNHTRN